jgi:hypothetical protein
MQNNLNIESRQAKEHKQDNQKQFKSPLPEKKKG